MSKKHTPLLRPELCHPTLDGQGKGWKGQANLLRHLLPTLALAQGSSPSSTPPQPPLPGWLQLSRLAVRLCELRKSASSGARAPRKVSDPEHPENRCLVSTAFFCSVQALTDWAGI